MSALPNHDRLLDLLTQQATQGLSDAETAELRELLREYPELTGDEFDASVAAILLGSKDTHEAMPSQLAATILAAAPVRTPGNVVPMPSRTTSRFEATGWWAAAACAALAMWGWWPRLMPQPVETPPQVAQLTPAQEREQLLSSGSAIQASWQPGNDPASNALQGDVVFDPVSQRGYLRFRGIPANDPRLSQYQLWIADGSRTQPQPVDGGVFDVSGNANAPQATPEGDVIIPFEAKLQIGQPAAFVVTVEQPGGVVVSSQERVLALAKVTF